MRETIEKCVHEYYWEQDINCARTALLTLGKLFDFELQPQTLHAAIGMHGAGGYRAQCGLVEGALMFLGCFLGSKGKTDDEISAVCRKFAHAFKEEFGSLLCFDLRPNGFNREDPPHLCEGITVRAIEFTYGFITNCWDV